MMYEYLGSEKIDLKILMDLHIQNPSLVHEMVVPAM
jgi:hypothetical protein